MAGKEIVRLIGSVVILAVVHESGNQPSSPIAQEKTITSTATATPYPITTSTPVPEKSPFPSLLQNETTTDENRKVDERINISSDELKEYLEKIQDNMSRLETIVSQNNLFEGFSYLSKEQRVEDFKMYYPIYKAAEIKYNVPWSLLWIIHLHESNDSRSPNPEASGYKGAMQRSSFYDDNYVNEAVSGWEFLSELPQRYHQKKGSLTSDYKEIFFAAKKIRRDADELVAVNQGLGLEEAILKAQFSYCAPDPAAQRIEQYRKIKNILK